MTNQTNSQPVDVLAVMGNAAVTLRGDGNDYSATRMIASRDAVAELIAADQEYDAAHEHYLMCPSHLRESHARMLASRVRRAAALAACGVSA